MKLISLIPLVDLDACNGCVICSNVCPTLAISLVDKKAHVKEADCRGCGACDQRCPVYAISMQKLQAPYTVGVAVDDLPYEKIAALCVRANLNPEQIICYCTATRAEEVAAAILKGATSPEDLSRETGIRTGCKVECIQPALRLLQAAGITPELWVEPGRFLVADSTVILTRVNSTKTAHKRFANVDAGFNLLVRPAMYDAYHEVIVANHADAPVTTEYTVTGPICETGDILAADRKLPELAAGDLIAVLDAGAYGFAMSSQYNGRPRCPEVLVHRKEEALMRRGETLADLIGTMVRPPWQR